MNIKKTNGSRPKLNSKSYTGTSPYVTCLRSGRFRFLCSPEATTETNKGSPKYPLYEKKHPDTK